jgi:hypothetical protein
MNNYLGKKAAGFYLVLISVVAGIVATIYYVNWSTGISALLKWDNDYIVIAATVGYAIALFQLLSDSVGSFVDAFQGIVMFGDATQVGSILTIVYILAASSVCMIIAGFMRRVKA